MKKTIAIIYIISIVSFSNAQKPNMYDPADYPYNNPVITHMYTADAAPHVMPDGKVWMVTSVDHEDGGGYATMHKYHTFSSADMVHWTDHGEVLHIDDLTGGNEPKNEDWALWAPDMIYRNGKYYLYFPVRILHTDTIRPDGGRVVTSYIAVAESNHPSKRFKVINQKLNGTRGIDPAVFIDDDDTPYLYWGSHMAAKLKENMMELASDPVKLDVDTDRFMEAVWMHKHNGKYYLSYHTTYNWSRELNDGSILDPDHKKSELWYSVSDHPLGPFTFGGVLNYEPGVGVEHGPESPEGNFVPWRLTLSNHGGIVEYHGKDYLFYHTSALSSWRQDKFRGRGTWTQRSVCIDHIDYEPSGKIIPVKQTVTGVDRVKVRQPFEILIPVNDLTIDPSDPIVPLHWVKLGSGYYYFSVEASEVSSPFLLEIRLDQPNGHLAGTMKVDRPGIHDTFLRAARGKRQVYLVARNLKNPVRIVNPKFFAGNGNN